MHERKYQGLAVLVMSLISLLFAWGCDHEQPLESQNQGLESTFSSIQQNIFNRKCAIPGCHTGSAPGGNLNLSAGAAYNNLINVNSSYGPPRVAPGDLDNSVLYQKITGNSQFGSRMPLGGSALSQEEIKAIADWILAGAPNN